ncbi:MAG: VIT1/CCC1 transporter family protein [bacterium]|nr:VIT1/CCC1 transporter family protein [bacterium]
MSEKNLWKKIQSEAGSALDPISRISEVLFGLIMVLSFTGSISVASDGKAEIKDLLWAALGCNLAWGIIDGVFYLMTRLFEKGHAYSVLKKLKSTTDKAEGRKLLTDELPPIISVILKPEEVDQIHERLVKLGDVPKSVLFSWSELRTAFIIFLLVFTCTFPVALPFIFINNTASALRISNGIALLILFIGGFSVGKYSGFRPFVSGIAILLLGVTLVAITMALGG